MSEAGAHIVTVSRDQISAARALIELNGSDNVSPLIRKIAEAATPPAGRSAKAARAS